MWKTKKQFTIAFLSAEAEHIDCIEWGNQRHGVDQGLAHWIGSKSRNRQGVRR